MVAVLRRRRSPIGILCVLAGLALAGGSAAQALFAIPTDSLSPDIVPDGQPLRVVLHARDPSALAGILGVAPPAPGTDVLPYVMDGYPVIAPGLSSRWSEPSFLVDFRDPAVAELSDQLSRRRRDSGASGPPAPGELVDFVAGMVTGSYDRDFDVASEVATHRRGDCKQYAVLTVALARAAGIPARFVHGLAVVHDAARYGAYGHAWAELFVGGRWVVADAAMAHHAQSVRYLPFRVLENEGMGFALDAARATPVWIQRLEILGAVPDEPRPARPAAAGASEH